MLFTEENFTEFLESLEGSAFKKKEIKKLKKHVADIVQYLNEEMEDTIFTELENYLYEYLPEAKKQKNVISMSDEDVEAAERQAQYLATYYEALDFEQEHQECSFCEAEKKQVKFLSLKEMREKQLSFRPVQTIEEKEEDTKTLFGTQVYEAIPVDRNNLIGSESFNPWLSYLEALGLEPAIWEDNEEANTIKSFVSWQGNDIITPGRTVFEEEKPKRFIILDSKGKPQSDFLSKKEAKEELKALQGYYDEYYDWQVVKVKIKAKKIKK